MKAKNCLYLTAFGPGASTLRAISRPTLWELPTALRGARLLTGLQYDRLQTYYTQLSYSFMAFTNISKSTTNACRGIHCMLTLLFSFITAATCSTIQNWHCNQQKHSGISPHGGRNRGVKFKTIAMEISSLSRYKGHALGGKGGFRITALMVWACI